MSGFYGTDYDDDGYPVVELLPGPTAFERSILTRSDLAGLEPVTSLVDGVLSSPAAALVVGGYGVGKTAFMLTLAASVATGQPFLGRDVKQARTLYVVGEGAYGLDARMAAWEYAWNRRSPLDDQALTFSVKPGSLAHAPTWAELTDYAVAGGYGLVILDTFSSLAPEADETKDAPRVIRWLSDLSVAIRGSAVLVHHPGWSDAGRSRGGYQLEANADEVLILTGSQDTPVVQVTRKKVKDGPSGGTFWVRRVPAAESITIEHASGADVTAPLADRILGVLDALGDIGGTGPQLMAELGIDERNRSTFYRALRSLQQDELVDKSGPHKSARYTAKEPSGESHR